jgi:hypothetical protein
VTLLAPWQTVAVEVVKAAGCEGNGLTAMETVRAALVPQPFVAVTLRFPDVALFEKLTVIELLEPVIVAPLPE